MLSTTAGAWSRRIMLLVFFLGLIHRTSAATTVKYCSSLNTATNNANSSIYQSDGLCTGTCDGFAFAVLDGFDCYCSNYVPGTTTDITKCESPCPGYPDDICGGDGGLFAYIALGVSPSGTVGGSTVPKTTAEAAHTAPRVTVTATNPASTVFITSLAEPVLAVTTTSSKSIEDSPVTSTTTRSQPITTPIRSSTSSSPSSTWTPTPSLSLETVTGSVRTVTVTPTAPPAINPNAATLSRQEKKGLGPGAIAGIVIAVVVGLALVAAVIFFWRKSSKKEVPPSRDNDDAATMQSGEHLFNGAGRTPTTRTQNGFLQQIDEKGNLVHTLFDSNGRRRSQMITVDSRLDHRSPMYRQGSDDRDSIVEDQLDYSAKSKLKVTNPDLSQDD